MNSKIIIKLLSNLKNKESLLLGSSNNGYKIKQAYIIGFVTGLDIALPTTFNIERIISKWYQERVDFKAPNLVFFSQFDIINNEKSDDEKIILLINLLVDFFSESSDLFDSD